MMDFISIAHAAETASESASGIASLGLNLKLFLAQLINFGIVLFVLWKWVFTPVAKKLTERTEKIEKAMNDADRVQKEKEEFGKWKDTEMVKIRSQAQGIIAAAENQGQKTKHQILEETKGEQSRLVEQAKTQIESEKNLQLQAAKGELADIVTQASEKILRSKLDKQKDQELIKESLKSI